MTKIARIEYLAATLLSMGTHNVTVYDSEYNKYEFRFSERLITYSSAQHDFPRVSEMYITGLSCPIAFRMNGGRRSLKENFAEWLEPTKEKYVFCKRPGEYGCNGFVGYADMNVDISGCYEEIELALKRGLDFFTVEWNFEAVDARILSEVYATVTVMGKEYTDKIPPRIWKGIKDCKSEAYSPYINPDKQLVEQGVDEDTIAFIAMLHEKFWCTEKEEHERLLAVLLKNEDLSEKIKAMRFSCTANLSRQR